MKMVGNRCCCARCAACVARTFGWAGETSTIMSVGWRGWQEKNENVASSLCSLAVLYDIPGFIVC